MAVLIVACVTPMMLLGVASVFLGRPIPFLNESLPGAFLPTAHSVDAFTC